MEIPGKFLSGAIVKTSQNDQNERPSPLHVVSPPLAPPFFFPSLFKYRPYDVNRSLQALLLPIYPL